MCTETGIRDVYRGVQGACPRRAVTHAGGTAERSERRAVGMGLKLVTASGKKSAEAPTFARLSTIGPMAIGTFGADNGLHSLVVSPVGAIQNQH